MPKRLVKEESSATPTYAKFIAEPFEAGYGHTIGNSLRRVLLSSLEGAAISSIKIEGAPHEFTAIPGVVEDVTDIILNLKKVLFKSHSREAHTVYLSVNKEGPVTAGDIKGDQVVEVLNPDQHICTLDKKQKFEAEFEVKVGRGFCPGDENKKPDQPIGIIAIDSRKRREGAPLEFLGWYNPLNKETNLNAPAIKKWMELGAEPSDTVRNLLKKAMVIEA